MRVYAGAKRARCAITGDVLADFEYEISLAMWFGARDDLRLVIDEYEVAQDLVHEYNARKLRNEIWVTHHRL